MTKMYNDCGRSVHGVVIADVNEFDLAFRDADRQHDAVGVREAHGPQSLEFAAEPVRAQRLRERVTL